MNAVARGIARVSRGWVVLLLGAAFAAFLFLLLPRAAQSAAAYAQDVGSPDTRFFYTAETLYDIAQTYGPDGRREYVQARLTIDLAFPLTYGLFFATSLAYTYGRVWPLESGTRRLPLLGLWAAVADLVENFALVGVMALYPDPSVLLASLAALATPVKWILVSGSLVLTVVGWLALAFAALRDGR